MKQKRKICMKGKFQILYIALATFTLSCSKSEVGVIDNSTERNITFAQMQTKGTLLGSSSILPSMDVIIYETDPNAPALSEDDVVEYNPISSLVLNNSDNSWSHSPAKVWPDDEDQQLTFLAMSPSMELADNPNYITEDILYYEGITAVPPTPITNLSENGLAYLPSITNNYYKIYDDMYGSDSGVISDDFLAVYYQVPSDVTKHPDLVFATAKDSYTSAVENVNLSFNHALTAVSFSVLGGTTQKITSIKLINVATEGYILYVSEFDEGSFWGGEPYIVNDYIESVPLFFGDIVAPISDVVPNRVSATSLTPEGSILMMIPLYRWYMQDCKVEVVYSDGSTETTQTLLFPNNHVWLSGVHYNYTITLPEGIGPMNITVKTMEWQHKDFEINTEDWGPGEETGTDSGGEVEG